MHIPQKLTILDGAMAMDGGSISLLGKDQSGNIVKISLGWSLEAQANGTVKLSLNKMSVEKRSSEEEKLLGVLKNADIQYSEAPTSPPAERAALGEDISEYTNAIENGPESALRRLNNQLISNVRSEIYTGAEPLSKKLEK